MSEYCENCKELQDRLDAADEAVSSSTLLDTHRGSRCGLCYWALYDGEWCQNKACKNHGQSVSGDLRNGTFVYLTNREAQVLIESNAPE